MTSHNFEIQNKVKDVGIEDMLKRMYYQEFNEGPFLASRRQGYEISISWNDKRFLSLSETTQKCRIRDIRNSKD